MSRTTPKRWAGALALLALTSSAATGCASVAADELSPAQPLARAAVKTRPNVLMITVDDASPLNLRYMPKVRHLIADRGVKLTNGVAPTAICVPARASLLTGQYAHNHGAHAISGPQAGFDDFVDDETLPVWLQRAGYDTMFIGKYLNGYGQADGSYNSHPSYVPPGWTDWRAAVGGSTTNYLAPTINHDGRVSQVRGYNSDLFSRYTVEQLREPARRKRPWFMMVNYVAPHAGGPKEAGDPEWRLGTPVPATRHRGLFGFLQLPRTPNMFEADTSDKTAASKTKVRLPRRARAAARVDHQQRVESLLAVDEAVAKAVRTLRKTRQLGDTVIIFSSDNGYLIGQHNRFAKPRHYEESQKVPMVLAGPGIPKGRRVATQVTNPDLATTVAAIAGARPGRLQDGVDIRPLLRQGLRNRVVPIKAWETKDGSQVRYEGVRTHNWTYVRFGNGEEELYNHQQDPYQLSNVAGQKDHLHTILRMRHLTRQYNRCAGPSCSG